MIDEIHSSDHRRKKMEGQSGVTRSIIVEIFSSDSQGDQM